MSTLSFGFTKLVVEDLETAVRFYGEVFGMIPRHRVTSDEHAFALDEVILSLGDAPGQHALILVRYRQRPCPPAGAAWTGFAVADLAATLAAVEQCGGSVEVPVHANAEHGVLAAIASDGQGHLIEIVQPLSGSGRN